jgi:hypothetical protein
MTVALGVGAAVAGGPQVEPAGAQHAPGSPAGSDSRSAGTGTFQSSWQSIVAALGEETNPGSVDKPQPGAPQAATLFPARAVQQSLPAAPETDATEASIARFRLNHAGWMQREANAVGAASATTPGTGLEGSDSVSKPVKHETGPDDGSEKKQAAANAANAQSASQPPIDIAVPLPVALPPLPQPVSATAAPHAQSLLTDASLAAEHRTAQNAAASGIATAVVNGTSLDGRGVGTGQFASSAGASYGVFSPPQSADSSSSTADTQLAGLVPATDFTVLNANADAVDTDSIADAAGAGPASIGSSIGSASAAHTVAAADKRSNVDVVGQATQRSLHGPADATMTSLQGHAPALQPIGAAGDASAFARDAAAGHGATNTLAPGSSGSTGAAPGSRETFVALDADAAHGASWLHAGAHSAEAGFEDPALGWVSVRADVAAGGVHAAVVPGTAEAAQALGSHMAGLTSYLSEQRTPVHTLTLALPGGDAGSNQWAGQGNGQDSGHRDGADKQAAQPAMTRGMPANTAVSVAIAQARPEAVVDTPAVVRAGSRISLIA